MSLTVKAYVLPCRSNKDDFEEIRRFTITQSDAKIFTKLFEKVCEVFPALDEDKLSLHWKDEDGDLIHFTTNNELAEAIKSETDGVFKLYAQEMPMFKDTTEMHVGVLCSSCRRPVQGSRYKCLACPDYDLCHSCELIGTHLEHTMIKIPTPATPWVAQIMQYSYTYGPMSPMSPMVLKCRNGDRGARILDDQSPPIMERPSFASSIGQQYPQNDWSLFNDTPMLNRPSFGQSTAMERSYQSEDMLSRPSRSTDLDVIEIADRSPYREGLFSYNESPPDNTSGDWTLLNSSKSKEVNEVTSSTSSTRIESSSARVQAECSRTREISSGIESSSIKMASASEVTSISTIRSKDEQDKVLECSDAADAESTTSLSDETKESSAAINGTVNDIAIEAGTTTGPSEDGGAVPSTDVVSTTTEVSGDMKPKVDNNVYIPSIRRYAEALDNLMSMGFTNEGGWLTVLVEEKRGDIIRVLDFIENNIEKCKENEQAKSRN